MMSERNVLWSVVERWIEEMILKLAGQSQLSNKITIITKISNKNRQDPQNNVSNVTIHYKLLYEDAATERKVHT